MQGIYLKELGINFVKTCLSLYCENIHFIGIFFTGILLFLSHKKEEKKYISIYVLFLFSTIFNPFAVRIVFGYFGMDEVYYRFFWLLPINIVVAYLCIHCISRMKTLFTKCILSVCVLIMILFLGQPSKTISQLADIPDNLYKVSDEVLEISEFIQQDCDESNPRVAPTNDLLMVLRQYDASIHLTLDRDRVLCWYGYPLFQYYLSDKDYQTQAQIMNVLYSGNVSDPEGFMNAIRTTDTQYVIFYKTIDIQSALDSFGAQYVAETDSYYIYKF